MVNQDDHSTAHEAENIIAVAIQHHKPEKRTSRACLICRKRKSQCLLPTVDGVVTTPCKRCKATGQECIIGASNRGGRRVRKRKPEALEESYLDSTSTGDDLFVAYPAATSHNAEGQPTSTVLLDPALQNSSAPAPDHGQALDTRVDATRESSTSSVLDQLQNPSDALGILASIASHDGEGAAYAHLISQYDLIKTRKLSISQVAYLLERYKRTYHPYFPIVPASALDTARILTASTEPVLLTAILVVASRDLVDGPQTFDICTAHMRALVSDLSAGGPCDVSAVEALLLLAEWTPYTSRSDAGNVGRGEEDREAWMHVGIALRIAYFLGLDRYSFFVREDKDPQRQRKRLTWTACYISDRQISIRLGRAFWSRGPGPLTTLRKEDFPTLSPLATGGEDFASIFQATLELTMLFSNVHDVLYSNPSNSMRSHLSGGYIKYIDDFRAAIYGWKSVWGGLTCNSSLKATLLMSYDFLRLYTCAFGFHATVKRAVPQTQPGTVEGSAIATPGRIFYNNLGAAGDARFIYEGLDAAKSLLTIVNTSIDPEQSLRYMPLRFYLYAIYSGVFLYRARSVGALSSEEEQSVRAMVQETINRLERAGLGSQHPASRYSRLLRLLWDNVERKERKTQHLATLENPYRPGSGQSTTEADPSVGETMGEFSWTDLEAVGRFVVNGSSGLEANDANWWSGFLPADSNSFLYSNMPDLDSWDPGVISSLNIQTANLDFDARVPIPFSVFPSSYKNNETSETTEVKTDARITVEGAGRDDRRETRREDIHITQEERRRPVRFAREEEIRYHEDDRRDTRIEVDREHYSKPFRRYASAQLDVEDRVYEKEDERLDITERELRSRFRPSSQSPVWQDKSTYPRQFDEKVTVSEHRTFEEPEHKHKLDMGYYDNEGHYHSFRHGLEKAADKILHPIHGSSHHHHHHDSDVVIEDREITVSSSRREPEYSSSRKSSKMSSSNTITIPSHHVRIGDLLILQGRPCQVIRITTSAQTGQHRYLGVDLFTKQLHEESSFVSNPSPSVYVQNMLGPVFKQYRVLDIRDDGRVVAMTESGDVKQGLRVLDQSELLQRLTKAYDSGRGSIRVLVINDEGRELAVDYRVVHGSRL